MRVLFWSQSFWPSIGGVEVLATRLLPALRQRGHEIEVLADRFAPHLPDEACFERLPVHRLPFLAALAGKDLQEQVQIGQRVAAIKRRFAPELIHLNALNPSAWYHLHSGVAYGSPLLVSLHAEWPGDSIGPETLFGRILRSADWVVCCSSFLRREFCRLVPELASRLSVVYGGLDAPAAVSAPPRTDAPRLLCLGRIAEEKGFDIALRAMPKILRRFPAAHLVVAGDGPARSDLEALARELGLGDAVDFLGWVPPQEVPELMKQITLVAVPSRQEAFGLTALEAAMMARPVVAARVGGLPEIVAHGHTGLLVEAEDAGELAGAIMSLLGDSGRMAEMGRSARDRAAKLFSWESYIDAYDSLYSHLGARSGHG